MQSRKELIKEAKEFSGTTAGLTFVRLLIVCVRDLRKANDSAVAEQVLKNQGAISELKGLIKALSLSKGFAEHNGAFDE